ncbi:MAG: hypothetical protein RJB45_314 [Pseudomonadota bacterium]
MTVLARIQRVNPPPDSLGKANQKMIPKAPVPAAVMTAGEKLIWAVYWVIQCDGLMPVC